MRFFETVVAFAIAETAVVCIITIKIKRINIILVAETWYLSIVLPLCGCKTIELLHQTRISDGSFKNKELVEFYHSMFWKYPFS